MNRLIVLLSLTIVACGDGTAKKAGPLDGSFDGSTANMPSSTASACSKASVAACGGNIVGIWKVVGICDHAMTEQQLIDENGKLFGSSVAQCGVSADILDDGYAEFKADGIWQIDENGGFSLGFSESCLKGIGQSCDSVRTYAPTDGGTSSWTKTCQSSNGTCLCTLTASSHRPTVGSFTTDATSYHLYNTDTSDNATRAYCVQGDVLSIFAPEDTFSGGGTVILTRSTQPVTDLDASVTFPKFDASNDLSPDLTKRDAGVADVATDKAPADAAHDTATDAPADKPKTDVALDAPHIDTTAIDVSPIDAQQVDATPLPLNAMPPSTAAACAIAATAPCGGDVTGSWKISGICDPWLSETEYVASLVACATTGDDPTTGAATFTANGTCTLDQIIDTKADFSVSCLTKANDTCSARDQRYKGAVGTNDKIAAVCTLTSSQTCHCDETFEFPAAKNACTYATNGTELTFITPPAAFDSGAFDYCVQGSVMTIFVAPTSAVGHACDTCTAGYVLTRAN